MLLNGAALLMMGCRETTRSFQDDCEMTVFNIVDGVRGNHGVFSR